MTGALLTFGARKLDLFGSERSGHEEAVGDRDLMHGNYSCRPTVTRFRTQRPDKTYILSRCLLLRKVPILGSRLIGFRIAFQTETRLPGSRGLE